MCRRLGHAGWGSCDPSDSRNRRQRCAVLVEINGTTILVDAGPDIRNQLLPHKLTKIDAVLITHTHSDHVAGLDDLRAFYWPERVNIKVYATAHHGKDMCQISVSFYEKAKLTILLCTTNGNAQIDAGTQISVGGCKIDILHQEHGNSTSLGFIFDGKFAYSTDVISMSDAVFEQLSGVELWIVEALRADRIRRIAIMNKRLHGSNV